MDSLNNTVGTFYRKIFNTAARAHRILINGNNGGTVLFETRECMLDGSGTCFPLKNKCALIKPCFIVKWCIVKLWCYWNDYYGNGMVKNRGQSWRRGTKRGCNIDWLWIRFPLEEMKYLFISSLWCPELGGKWGKECLNTRFPLLYYFVYIIIFYNGN